MRETHGVIEGFDGIGSGSGDLTQDPTCRPDNDG